MMLPSRVTSTAFAKHPHPRPRRSLARAFSSEKLTYLILDQGCAGRKVYVSSHH
jgi:hypothetical protein